LYRNFQTEFFEILLFCSVKRVVYLSTMHVIYYILCNCNTTLYKEYLYNMQLQTTSPESKFPNEYIGVIFIQIDQHLKKLFKKYKGFPIFWNTVYM